MDDQNASDPMGGEMSPDDASEMQDPSQGPDASVGETESSEAAGAPGGFDADAVAGMTQSAETADFGSAPDFEQLQEAGASGQAAPLAMLYDLDLPVAIELGRTRLAVQDVLALSRGSVVQLDRQAGEPVDVYVGDKRFAEAEVVIVGEQFGVRITRLVSNAGLPAVG